MDPMAEEENRTFLQQAVEEDEPTLEDEVDEEDEDDDNDKSWILNKANRPERRISSIYDAVAGKKKNARFGFGNYH